PPPPATAAWTRPGSAAPRPLRPGPHGLDRGTDWGYSLYEVGVHSAWASHDTRGTRMARMPSAQRRRQLTEAAIRAMARDGVPKKNTRSIAAEAGVSQSVFHYCFDSKEALVESVITTLTGHSVRVVKE